MGIISKEIEKRIIISYIDKAVVEVKTKDARGDTRVRS